jgi:uncharacterized protein YciI
MTYKKTFMAALLCLMFAFAHAQTTNVPTKPAYNEALAKKLGADDYGMKRYVMAFLKTGPTKITDKTEMATLQMAHLKNITRLADEGKLVVAGPFISDKELQGIFIFNVTTIEEAKQLTETDPAIKAGVLIMELKPFYCSAALMEIANIHKTLQKKGITD